MKVISEHTESSWYTPNESNFSASINFRRTRDGSFWDNAKSTIGSAWPVGFLLREVLSDPATDYALARAQLRKSQLIAPTYITLCGGGTGQGTLITRDRDGEVSPVEIATTTSTRDCTLVTNTDHWEVEGNGSGGASTNNFFMSCQRARTAESLLAQLRKKPEVTTEDMWGLLSTSPVRNEITTYGTVMLPALGYYQTRLPKEHPVGYRGNIILSGAGNKSGKGDQ